MHETKKFTCCNKSEWSRNIIVMNVYHEGATKREFVCTSLWQLVFFHNIYGPSFQINDLNIALG